MATPARSILFRITNSGDHLNNTELVDRAHTNFSQNPNFQFSEHKQLYWRVIQNAYERSTATSTVTVVNYSVTDYDPHFSNQSPKAEVKNIRFSLLKWSALEGQLSVYRKDDFTSLLKSSVQATK